MNLWKQLIDLIMYLIIKMFNRAKHHQQYLKKFPWLKTLHSIAKRCNNPKYVTYQDYGGRGIKCLISAEELKELWFRDKAYLMKKPSIDREDNDGNYTFDNCRYVEHSENARLGAERRWLTERLLTPAQEKAIIQEYTGEIGQKTFLAKKYGAHISTITKLVGKSYTHEVL